MMYIVITTKQSYTYNKGMPVANSIHHSNHIYNYFKSLKLGLILSDVYHNHLMTIMVSIFLCGYRGKTIDFAEVSCQHRTTTASHTKPSSQALHPIEAAYFHQSHLKGCQDYGHQVVSVMLSCNGIILNYAVILYDRSKLKIRIVQEIAEELPVAPVISYFLCDSWYTSAKVMDSFIRKGFYTIGALKTNRIIYPCGIRRKVSGFVLHLKKTDSDVSLVTVGGREFYVYRYEGKLALDKYQIRSRMGIQRYWLIMSLAHYMCCMHSGKYCTFEEGYRYFQEQIKTEQLMNLHSFIKSGASLEAVLEMVG